MVLRDALAVKGRPQYWFSMHPLLVEFQALARNSAADLGQVINLGARLKGAGFVQQSNQCFAACIQVLQGLIAQGNIEQSLLLESALYGPLVKSTETEAHYHKCFAQWSPQFQELGRKHRKAFAGHRDPRKICFVLPNGVLLGHTEVMFRVVDSWMAQGIKCDLYVYAFGGCRPDFKEMLERRGIKLLLPTQKSLAAIAAEMRAALEHHGIHTAVWLGPPVLMSYAFGMGLAPRQIVWSVKFHPVWMPEVAVHICGGHELETARNYNGRDWTVAPFPLTLDPKPNDSAAVQMVRNKFPPDAILLGTLAREEKFTFAPFLKAVCALLSRNPKTHFLWTGRSQPEMVLSAFKKAGVVDRCHFIGWVDTNLYAEVLDIFLETFPFGCGITGFQAMSHGTPLLSKVDPDTLYGLQLSGAVAQQFKGGTPSPADFEALGILTAVDKEHYVQLAQRLIDDPQFRAEIAAREKAYFQGEQDALPRYARRLWLNISGIEV